MNTELLELIQEEKEINKQLLTMIKEVQSIKKDYINSITKICVTLIISFTLLLIIFYVCYFFSDY